VFTAALAALLSVVQVYVRDMRYVVQASVQPWLYLTPVLYPLSTVERYRRWLEVNPAAGIVELFRASIGGADPGWHRALEWTIGWTALFFVVAIALFRRFDRVAVDRL